MTAHAADPEESQPRRRDDFEGSPPFATGWRLGRKRLEYMTSHARAVLRD